MSLEGQIIEFLDADQLRVAYVRKQERDRLHVVDPRGRNHSVSGDRVVIVHRPVPESEFPSIAREISEKVAARQLQVDVELLWQSIGVRQRELPPTELAELFFAEDTPEAASAVFRALAQDTLFFKRRGSQFLPKTEEQVSTELTRRQRQREREDFRERAVRLISRFVRTNTLEITPESEILIDRVHSWLKHRSRDEIGEILQEVAGITKARDAAYDILQRAGRIPPDADRFLVTAGIEYHFGPAILNAADLLDPYTHDSSRLDYRDIATVTIDDDDTLEVDDALSLTRSGNEIIVGVHIADVSSFVAKSDLLDAEAGRRSSTIYLPTVTVRMFPERLSTDLVSLTRNLPRPAFTVEVRFDEQGTRVGYRISLSTIRVDRRMSYEEADQEIESGGTWLKTLHTIAAGLQLARAERGAITFRRPELKVRVRDGQIHIKKINPNSASRLLVSEMMIMANGLAADFASVNSLPVIFRTQEAREALAIEDAPVIEALAFERLRKTFKRSRLSLTPGMHSGLGLTAYTQASSPIRRYADLVTQRQFTSMLRGNPVPYSREELLQILVNAEAAEQEIRVIEDRSTNYWLLEYLAKERKNQRLPAIVIDARGTVELEDLFLRARIADAARYQPGETIQLELESIDPARGEVRFKQHG